jgi:pilus assembly protein CpaC
MRQECGVRFSAYNSLVIIGLLLVIFYTAEAHAQYDDPGDREQPSDEQVEHKSLRLEVGQQKVLGAEGVRSFSEGKRGIIDVRLTKDNQRFVLVGQRAGETTLLLIMHDGGSTQYDITVDDPNAIVPEEKAPVGLQRRDNIRLDFYFVLLTKSAGLSAGINWPLDIWANLGVTANLVSGTTGTTAVLSAQALPRLDMAQTSGWAKILRKAAVLTANGTAAEVTGGGEVNIAVSGGYGGSIKSIRYGSTISVRPQYDKTTGRIEIQLSAQVSDLAPDNGSGVPGRITSSLETLVNLELGQSIVLAGLSSASETKSRSGLPGLSQIPILGALFGTHSSESTESETAIFIVPSVMDAVTTRQRGLIADALQAYEDFSGDVENYQLMPEVPLR